VAIGQTVTKIWKFFKMAAAAVSVVHRIHKNDVQNLQAVHAKFSFFWCRILTTLTEISVLVFV